jgi:hypothetical protein
MLRLGSFLRNPFAFLFARSKMEDQVAAYLVREHAQGRPVGEILADHYVQNRLTPQQQARLLDRADVIHSLGEQSVSDARRYVAREGL